MFLGLESLKDSSVNPLSLSYLPPFLPVDGLLGFSVEGMLLLPTPPNHTLRDTRVSRNERWSGVSRTK